MRHATGGIRQVAYDRHIEVHNVQFICTYTEVPVSRVFLRLFNVCLRRLCFCFEGGEGGRATFFFSIFGTFFSLFQNPECTDVEHWIIGYRWYIYCFVSGTISGTGIIVCYLSWPFRRCLLAYCSSVQAFRCEGLNSSMLLQMEAWKETSACTRLKMKI